MPINPPVFLFAFANDKENSLKLEEEDHQLRDELSHLHDSRRIEFLSVGATTMDVLIGQLNRFHERITLFHFGGHSESSFLELRDQKATSEQVATLLGMADKLQLVFLNGCANKEQVKVLHEKGVRSVIATSVPINDDKAVLFSKAFYNALRYGKNIEQAFKTAEVALQGKVGIEEAPKVEIKLYRSSSWDGEDDSGYEEVLPWGLYAEEEDYLGWLLPKRPPMLGRSEEGHVQISGEDVVIGDKKVCSLESSEQYQQLKTQLAPIEEKWAKAKKRVDKYPDDEDFQEEYQTINNEREAILEQMETIRRKMLEVATEFTKVPVLSERLARAQEYFATGDFMAARAVLNPEQMIRDFDQLAHMKKKGEGDPEKLAEQLGNNANEFSILASLTASDLSVPDHFKKASYYFEKAITASRDSEEPEFTAEKIMTYAYFLEDNNQEDDALPLFQEAAEMVKPMAKAEPERFEPGLAQILNDLGALYYKLHNFEEAGKSYYDSLEISTRLAKEEQATYQPVIATTRLNLAMVYEDTGQIDKARATYEEGMSVFEQLAEENPAEYEQYFAHALNNIGTLHLNQGAISEAIDELSRAYEIRFRLAEEQDEDLLVDAADTLGNLGLAHFHNEDAQKADEAFRAALDMLRPLAEKDPDRFEPDYAAQLSNLGLIYKNAGQFEPASERLSEALEIYKRLTPTNVARFTPDLVNSLANVSELLLQTSQYREAGTHLKEALKASRQLVEANAAANGYNHIRLLILSLYQLGSLQETEEGADYRKEAHPLIAETKQTLALFDASEEAIQQQQQQLQQYIDYFGES